MENLTEKNIWKVYAPLFSKITPNMSEELLKFATCYLKNKVLDAGCGVGKAIPYIITNKDVSCIDAVDSNHFMIQEAKGLVLKLNPKIPVNILFSDIENYNFQTSYDSILSLNVVYTLKDPISFFKKSYSLLNEGGRLVISSPNKNMDMNKLEAIVDKEFDINDITYNDFKKCNHFLVGLGFKPKLYSLEEIEEVLENIGFNIIYLKNDHYHGCNFSVVAEKK